MTNLTEDQRARLNSRPSAILRGLIADMTADAEDAAINYAVGVVGKKRSAAAADRTVDAQAVLAHAHRVLALWVVGPASWAMLGVWDEEARALCAESRAATIPWRARLGAALAIPDADGGVRVAVRGAS